MNKQCIVTTSINRPTKATLAWCNRKNYDIIMVGDLKTPQNDYVELMKKYNNFKYLGISDQEDLSKELSDAIGWNKIQRRNMGFLYAYKNKYEVIGSFDDDNIIDENWSEFNFVNKDISVADIYRNNIYDALDPFYILQLKYHHRGYPLEFLKDSKCEKIKTIYSPSFKCLVNAPIPYGDPDIDAVTRIIMKPTLDRVNGITFSSYQIMPFNSQCTFISREILKYYFMFTGVGRHDDILGSYVLQKRMKENGYSKPFIVFSDSIARQDRNEHDLFKDLEQEIWGYCNMGKYINATNWRDIIPEESLKVYDLYEREMKRYE